MNDIGLALCVVTGVLEGSCYLIKGIEYAIDTNYRRKEATSEYIKYNRLFTILPFPFDFFIMSDYAEKMRK